MPTMKFTMEKEDDNRINFLDLTVQKDNNNLSFNVYRKPTTTDTINPRDSYHPQKHKHAAIRYLVNSMNTYELNPTNNDTENNTIKHILHRNKYDSFIVKQFRKTKRKEQTHNAKK
jgi:predicted ATPase